jgi:hypothetical protein
MSLPGPSFSTIVKNNPKASKDAQTQTDAPESTLRTNTPHYQAQKSTASTQTTFNNTQQLKSPKKNRSQGNRQHKGSDDPIKLYNRFGDIESMDAEDTAPCSQSNSRPNKKITPVLPPDK